jgi:hypothetical protein
VEEAERRYHEYKQGRVASKPAAEAIRDVRKQIR